MTSRFKNSSPPSRSPSTVRAPRPIFPHDIQTESCMSDPTPVFNEYPTHIKPPRRHNGTHLPHGAPQNPRQSLAFGPTMRSGRPTGNGRRLRVPTACASTPPVNTASASTVQHHQSSAVRQRLQNHQLPPPVHVGLRRGYGNTHG